MIFELKKMYSKKKINLVICLMVINLLFLMLCTYGTEQNIEVSPKAYKAVFRAMEGMSNQEKREYLREQSENDNLTSISDYKRNIMIQNLLEDAEKISEYESYLSQIEAEQNQKSVLGFLTGEDEFEKRSSEKMKKIYSSLHGTKVSFESSEGIWMADVPFTNILLLFLTIFFSMECLVPEMEEGILPMLRCCKNGRGKLIGKKICCLAVNSFLISAIFLIENIVFGSCSYGVGNLFRPLQSLPGYEGVPFRISVLEFLILVYLIRATALFIIAMLAMMLTVLTYQTVFVSLLCMLTAGISYWLFSTITLQSAFVFFYYINPVAWIKATPLLKSEVNLNVFGFPVSPCFAAAVCGLGLLFFLLGSIFFLFVRTSTVIQFPAWKKRPKRGVRHRFSVGKEERYKLLVIRKGLILLGVVFAIQLVFYPRNYVAHPEEICEEGYLIQLKGEVSERQEQWILEERKRLESNLAEADNQIKKEVLEKRIYPLYVSLSEKTESNENAEFIEQIGYRKMFGIEDQMVVRRNVMLYVILIVLAGCLYVTMEKTSGMYSLIESTELGWKRVRTEKRKQALIFSTIGMLAVWLPDFVWYFKYYGFSEWNKPLSWLLEFSDWNGNIQIWMYLVVLWIIRLSLGSLLCCIVLWISEKSRNSMESLILNTFLFVVPAVLSMTWS